MPRKYTESERLAKISMYSLKRKSESELQKILKTLQYGYKRRVAQFEKHGVYSYAQRAYEDAEKAAKVSAGKASKAVQAGVAKVRAKKERDVLIGKISRLQSFFESETSKLKGIRKIEKEQDIRVFGADAKGNPKRTLDKESRKLFWDLYNEFVNANAAVAARMSSDRVQQALASALGWSGVLGASRGTPHYDKAQLLRTVELRLEFLERQRNIGRRPNVFSGRGR